MWSWSNKYERYITRVTVDGHYFMFWPSTSQNKLSFTLCSIHIWFISNEFNKFWMSCDFKRSWAKIGRKWAWTQADRPHLGRPAWHPNKPCHIFDPGTMWHECITSESWIERRFDQMDRKACTRIKGPTTQWELASKSVIQHPKVITSVECNIGITEGRDVLEGGRPA